MSGWLPDRARRAAPQDGAEGAPLLAGILLVGFGAVLSLLRPAALNLPGPRGRARGRAGKARDAIAGIAPDNFTQSLGRTCLLMGAALIAIRALDAADERDLF